MDEFSTKCAFCQKQKIEIKEIAKTIDKAVKVPGRSRRNYDRYISKLSKHMQKEHGFYAPYYFTYLRSFFGIIAGLLIGYFLTLFLDSDTVFLYSIGFVSGLFPGYVMGSIKDKKIRRTKKLM